ncbi:MAG TPA: aminoglycoside phosphotransferase [Acidimicrobiia bacterium]|nr:aminoglycoside phosphotransferase [Acidimicrobiia bacterium]
MKLVGTLESVLAGASDREPMTHTDSKSGARFERVTVDGERFVVKYLDIRDDWTMRATGQLAYAPVVLWRRGLLDRLPSCFVQPIVDVATADGTPGHRQVALIMRDIGEWLVPEGDDELAIDTHLQFLDHLAALCAAFWGGGHDLEVVPMTNRYLELSPWTATTEAAIESDAVVPQLVGEGWERFPDEAPRAAELVLDLARDPSPLVGALETTPLTFVHGNWKLGNLGCTDDGRTVLFDWETPGIGTACGELAWYLAINAARLPHSKEETIDAFRIALRLHGIDTEPWWERQLGLALLGGLVHFGWEKALGGRNDELEWWEQRALDGARFLDSAR